MHAADKMKILLCLTFLSIAGIFVQENAAQNIPSSIFECYNTTDMLIKDNRLPHNVHSLIAIIRKIENTAGLNMDLRTLSVALLHRFRIDGIERDPSVPIQDGIVPFSPSGFSFFRNAAMLRLITGNAVAFPNNSLTAIERCTLHYMLSSSVELQERGDENTVCSSISQGARPRVERNTDEESATESDVVDKEVETTIPEEPAASLDPVNTRITNTVKQSSCPVENGVILTNWGAVSAGPVIAGIASSLVQQIVPLTELINADLQQAGYASGSPLHNRWLATFAGDLAEVALRQRRANAPSIGAIGGFNSTALPRWYFLTASDNLEMTTAEIRGDLDGLILADSAATWYSRVPSLRLSQILDMYYSSQGVFNSSMRACNRNTHFATVAANSTMVDQAFSAALLLHETVARGHISPDLIRSFTNSAAVGLNSHIPAALNNDQNCNLTQLADDFNKASTHLTIILDTTWPFTLIQSFLATLLEGIEVGMYNSNFTLISGHDGSVIINSSNTLLDFYNFNSTQYANLSIGFDLPKAIASLQSLQSERLNREQSQNIGGSSSDVVLIISYLSTISDSDREFCAEQLRIMRDQVPDAQFLYLTHGSNDTWSSLAVDAATDVFTTSALNTANLAASVNPVVSRIKEVPKRLINSACGASFSSSGSSASFDDYVEPSGTNYYRLHPNYFSSETATIRVKGAGWGFLNVCTSRTVVRPNATVTDNVSCSVVGDETIAVTFSCGDAELIRSCQPLYLSVATNTSNVESYQCTDPNVCRYPDMRKYTISYENLVCRSGANVFFIAPFILIISFALNLLNHL